MTARVVARMRARAPRRPAGGFTLIELVAAFVILAVAMGLFMELAGSSLRTARRSSDFTHAALFAQIKLDELGIGEPLQEGSDSGRFDDRFDYVLDIRKQDPPPAGEGGGPAVNELVPVELYRVELTVRWEDGPHERDAKFVTLRATQPGNADASIDAVSKR